MVTMDNGYAPMKDGHSGNAPMGDGHNGNAPMRDGHNGNAPMRDGHQGDRSESAENARIASLRQSLKKFLVFQYLSRWGRELQRGR